MSNTIYFANGIQVVRYCGQNNVQMIEITDHLEHQIKMTLETFKNMVDELEWKLYT